MSQLLTQSIVPLPLKRRRDSVYRRLTRAVTVSMHEVQRRLVVVLDVLTFDRPPDNDPASWLRWNYAGNSKDFLQLSRNAVVLKRMNRPRLDCVISSETPEAEVADRRIRCDIVVLADYRQRRGEQLTKTGDSTWEPPR